MVCGYPTVKQELSYHKQIARQLRKQYVEGIYNNHVTLKSRLRVTQGNWKRHHCVDHTRITISRVLELFDIEYYRDLETWVRGHARSLKMALFNRPCMTFYRPAIVTIALSCTIFELF